MLEEETNEVALPEPYPWRSPITLEQYAAFIPEKLELVRAT